MWRVIKAWGLVWLSTTITHGTRPPGEARRGTHTGKTGGIVLFSRERDSGVKKLAGKLPGGGGRGRSSPDRPAQRNQKPTPPREKCN